MTKKKFMVRWNDIGERGFESPEAAQHFIEKICKVVAPDILCAASQEF